MNIFAIIIHPKISMTLSCMLILSGCFESNRSTNQLCENRPQICHGLNNNDGQCRHERTDLIWMRYDVDQEPSDLNKFDELIITKKYAKCMDLAAQIESTTLKSKRTLRTEALLHAYDSIEKIEQDLKSSYQPSIIYYRWSQGDKEAVEQFLKLEETHYLDTPELQLGLATYYVNKDKSHTIDILLKALSLYDGRAGQTQNRTLPEIIKTLATSYHGIGKLNEAYLWALVGENLGLPVANDAQLKLLYPMTDKNRDLIENMADDITSAIKDGDFNANLLNSLPENKQ